MYTIACIIDGVKHYYTGKAGPAYISTSEAFGYSDAYGASGKADLMTRLHGKQFNVYDENDNPITRMFGKYGPIQTAEFNYQQGYQSGLNWKDSWVPAGPFVLVARDHEIADPNKKDWVAFCNAHVKNNQEYLRGWKDGLTKQNPNHPLLSKVR